MAQDEAALSDAFYRDLAFGTGGLRGVIGAGTNRMNVYTVAKASQGLANYVVRRFSPAARRIAVSYDSRIKSDLFARVAAGVFAANGISVFIYPHLMPTPCLSYAVRALGCAAGVMVTASHNPAKYNGYKVYGSDGCQITTEAADEALREIERLDIFADVKQADFDTCLADGSIQWIPDSVYDNFTRAVRGQSVLTANDPIDRDVSIVYTPLNGTGLQPVTRALRESGFTRITVVPEQEKPDGDFPTCPYPNPEEKSTLQLGIELCRRCNGDLVLATDPDADRVGVAVKHNGDYVLPTGNEIGVLMLDYIAQQRIAQGTMPKNPIVVRSIVSTPLVDVVAKSYGIQVVTVLTGFKYIGEQITLLAERGEEDRFLLGFEESYGYLTGGHVRDKDAVNGSMIICEMAEFYKKQGKTLIDALEDIFRRFGVYAARVKGYTFEGTDGMDKMAGIMKQLRETPPQEFGGFRVLSRADYQSSKRVDLASGTESTLDLPSSNVLEYGLEDNLKLIIRPSGTEPKIKVYLTIVTNDRDQIDSIAERLFESAQQWMK